VLGLILLAWGAACSGPADEPARTSPNVILISIDTLRADHLSCYGYKKARTASIDRLAAEGILFEQAISPVPLTLPSHASLLTGTLPISHGIRDNTGFVLSDAPTTLAQVLGSRGYRTGGVVGAFVLDSRFGLVRGFDYYFDNFESGTLETASLQVSERRGEDVLAEAQRWVAQNPEQPFFAFIHLFDPHAPYAPPVSFQNALSPYDGEVAYVDAQLGTFFAFLQERGLWKDSLVVLTADHGEGLGEHGEAHHGMFLYDSTLHVPLILKLPDAVGHGRRVSDQVRLIDVMPTILDIIGQSAPETVQGVSLQPAWKTGQLPELAAYSETQLPFLNYGWSGLDSYRAKGEKLIDAPRPELYNLKDDPRETQDLFSRHRERALQLREVKQRIVGTAARLPSNSRQARVDQETIRRLRSLGYMAGGSSRMPQVGPNQSLADPKDKIGLFNRISEAQLASQEGKFEESVELLKEVLLRDPSVFFAHSVQALNYLELKRPADALPHLRSAVKLRSEDQGAHFYLAMALMQLGRTDQAIPEMEVALRLDPENEAAVNNLATMYLQKKQFDSAVPLLERITREHPQDVAAFVNLGLAQMLQKQLSQSMTSFERALQLNPNIPEAHNNLGLLCLEMNQPDQAILHFERALALRPDYANARENLARARAK